jgi:hypothetical protein
LVSGGFNLEFEYSTITNSARITHRPPIQAQPGQEDSLSFLEFEQSSSCQSSSELPNAHDLPPSAEVDWNEVFSDQEQPNLFSPQHNETMFPFESVFPEPGLLSHSFDQNSQQVPLPSFEIVPDITNAMPSNEDLGEQDSLWQFGMFLSDAPTSQIQSVFEEARSFQDLRPFTPSPITNACFDIRDILSNLGMPHYIHDFLEHGFDTWEAIVGITESDFDVLGVKLGHRRKLQRLIASAKMTSEVPLGSPSNKPSDTVQRDSSRLETSMGAISRVLSGTRNGKQVRSRAKKRPENLLQKGSMDRQVAGKDNSEQSQSASRQSSSRASSTSSYASSNGRSRIAKAFSRRGSTQEEACPGYQVWDSRSATSASSSINSTASSAITGRRGPLSGAARAMANAIKAVKACWRCKFMRKQVSLSPPSLKCAC